MYIDLLQLLLLIVLANGAPILIRAVLKDRFDIAVDFGKKLPDHQRILGASKTWRGIIATIEEIASDSLVSLSIVMQFARSGKVPFIWLLLPR